MKRFRLLIIGLWLMAVLAPQAALAIDPDLVRLFENDIGRVDLIDPGSCAFDPNRGPQEDLEVAIIGDSTAQNIVSADLKEKLAEKNWTIAANNTFSGRQIDQGDNSGLVAVNDIRDDLLDASALVIALGTNPVGVGSVRDDADRFGDGVAAMITEARRFDKELAVYWVDIAAYGDPDYASSRNDRLYELAGPSNLNFKIIGQYKLLTGGDPFAIEDQSDNENYNSSRRLSPVGADIVADQVTETVINTSVSNQSEDAAICNCGGNGSGASGDLPSSIPHIWRTLINNAAPKYPDADPRLVAAVLWVENRGWPEYRTSGWAESPSGARGPWQFIPQTWFGWGKPEFRNWSRVNDSSAYRSNGMARDGNNDGFKNPSDPADAVESAFVHMRGSAGKPIVEGLTGDADFGWNNLLFKRDSKNLVSYAANYNGPAYGGSAIYKDLPVDSPNSKIRENTRYIQMSYWLLATNFTRGYIADGDTKFVNAATYGPMFEGVGADDPGLATEYCADGVASTSPDGHAFPIDATKATVRSFTTLPCVVGPKGCHDDDTPAFDLTVNAVGDTRDEEAVGTNVFAISDGTIDNLAIFRGRPSCYALSLRSNTANDQGFVYKYIYIQNPTVSNGEQVRAGQQIAEIGSIECGGGDEAHLHIDRGSPRGQDGGKECCRDEGIIDLINGLYDRLSEV